jgi:uncharacterized membrane protein
MLKRAQRLLKHRWAHVTGTEHALSPKVLRQLEERVGASELQHSGEIRIFVEAGLPNSYLWSDAPGAQIARQRALSMFGKLRVWDTARNNGVLIYLLMAEHAIELVADRGLNECVPPEVWQSVVARMRGAFQKGDFQLGLTQAIDEVTALLAQHFPLVPGESNPNELPNTLVVTRPRT